MPPKDLGWTAAPHAWYDGPFLGNGMFGSMLHQMMERRECGAGFFGRDDRMNRIVPLVGRDRRSLDGV